MVAGGAAAAAALMLLAEQQRQETEKKAEEEEMTGYSDEDLHDDWEFKIVKSHLGAFESPHVLRTVCQEESSAGWVLVEKFDNSRLRFKRPKSAKAGDKFLKTDPYRTEYGISEGMLLLIGLLVAGLVFVLLIIILKMTGFW